MAGRVKAADITQFCGVEKFLEEHKYPKHSLNIQKSMLTFIPAHVIILVITSGLIRTLIKKEKQFMLYDEVTVGQFCSLYIEETEKVRIWSLEKEEVLWEGTYRDTQSSEYADEVICSFGIEDGLNCINI